MTQREMAIEIAYTILESTKEEGIKLFLELQFLHHIPNGGFRHKAVAGKMKAQGVMAGVPDFYLDVARGGWHGVRLELKSA